MGHGPGQVVFPPEVIYKHLTYYGRQLIGHPKILIIKFNRRTKLYTTLKVFIEQNFIDKPVE